jgi:hypothetical protein
MAKTRYKKKRRRSDKKDNRRLMVIIATGVLVVLVVAGMLMNKVLKVSPTPVVTEQVIADPNNQPLHPRLEPLMDAARAYTPDGAPSSQRPLPANTLVRTDIDIDADGRPEILTAQLRSDPPALDRNLIAAGYETIVNSLIISRNDIAVLRIDEYAMRDQRNRRIISQVPAPYGYAVQISKFEDDFDFPFSAAITILEAVIIDEFGRGISDAITLYWHPEREVFQATNTLGAPGTW